MLYAQHRWWLDEPGKRGQPHTDNPRRSITGEVVQGYLERWDMLAREPNAPLTSVTPGTGSYLRRGAGVASTYRVRCARARNADRAHLSRTDI